MQSNPFLTAADRQLKELFDEDFKPITTILSQTTKTLRPNTTENTPTKPNVYQLNNKKLSKSADKTKKAKTSPVLKIKRASVIDPPVDFKDEPNFNDSFEMLESIINESYIDDQHELNDEDIVNLLNANLHGTHDNSFYLHEKNKNFDLNRSFYLEKESVTLGNESVTLGNESITLGNESINLNSLLNVRKYSDDMSSIDPQLINENDNLSIPDNLNLDSSSPISNSDNIDAHLDHYSVQYDKKISEIENSLGKSKSKVLKHSTSMFENSDEVRGDVLNKSLTRSTEGIDGYGKNRLMNGTDSSDKKKIVKNDHLKSSNLKRDHVKNDHVKKEQIKNNHTVTNLLKNDQTKQLQTKTKSKLPSKNTIQKSTTSLNSSFGCNGSGGKERKKDLSSLKRSISLLDPVTNSRLKSKEEVDNYFDELDQKMPGGHEKIKREVSMLENFLKLLFKRSCIF